MISFSIGFWLNFILHNKLSDMPFFNVVVHSLELLVTSGLHTFFGSNSRRRSAYVTRVSHVCHEYVIHCVTYFFSKTPSMRGLFRTPNFFITRRWPILWVPNLRSFFFMFDVCPGFVFFVFKDTNEGRACLTSEIF